MKIAIVGTGHGGCAIAATLAMQGHDVSLLKLSNAIHNGNFAELQRSGTIQLTGMMGEGRYPLKAVSRDPGEVIPEAELILVYYVANYHAAVAEAIAPYLDANQCVVLNPGYLGSLIIIKALQAQGVERTPMFVEFAD